MLLLYNVVHCALDARGRLCQQTDTTQGSRMYFKLFLILLIWFEWINVSILCLVINLVISSFGKRFFAGFCSNFADKYNELAHAFKMELFKDLNSMKSGEKISILEVGAGSGANFKYYTRDAVIQAVEPNKFFESHFLANKAKFPMLDIKEMKIGYGEDLASAGVEDSSVDAVVMTLVLCSVQDQQKCFQEIKRVLKPDGKFFFMEHILDTEDTTIMMIQKILTQCGFWPFAFDGCYIDRDTDNQLQLAGFSHLQQKKYDLPAREDSPAFFKVVRTFIKKHTMGVATK